MTPNKEQLTALSTEFLLAVLMDDGCAASSITRRGRRGGSNGDGSFNIIQCIIRSAAVDVDGCNAAIAKAKKKQRKAAAAKKKRYKYKQNKAAAKHKNKEDANFFSINQKLLRLHLSSSPTNDSCSSSHSSS
eukprot:CAMPEP_0113423000 /NCGR_PEP_ID=MMETSP0013_2-20120614/28776_1 /TAXON_ID=2843 ORGANISM="Skeletonema costatum, Strain 1716" /NCGR_SAMPLE_ID=MMETSP0013_2 /ASSEMBLY_ACC=CAM_ASM_000158 /LENGTH=131 /DNA_ID=CAMNT_0000310813 /DNA_START=327 /DNA_END=720 /DNA_ORIENTATION=- /assembly_acc=CAM_ASM_000158